MAGFLILATPPTLLSGALSWNLRHSYQRHLERCFFELLQARRGRISLMDFAVRAKISGQTAEQYLNQQAKVFQAHFDVVGTEVVYQFPQHSDYKTILGGSSPNNPSSALPHELAFAADFLPADQPQGNALKPGEFLYPGDYLRSDNETYILRLQTDGNLVLFERTPLQEIPLWASKTVGQSVHCLMMELSGNLSLYSTASKLLWSTATDSYPQAYLRITDQGEAVVFSSQGVPLWRSSTAR